MSNRNEPTNNNLYTVRDRSCVHSLEYMMATGLMVVVTTAMLQPVGQQLASIFSKLTF
jgi:hypothetical protein